MTLLAAACSSGESTAPPLPPTAPLGPLADFRPGPPAPWFGGSSRADLFEVGIDRGIRRSGLAAAYLRSRTSPIGGAAFATIGQSVSAIPYRGRRVRLTGMVKVDSVSEAGAGLWMRVDGPTRTLGFDNMISFGRGILGSRDWAAYSVVLDVPESAIAITLGALLSGPGTLRVDDISVENFVERDLMLIKVTCPAEKRPELSLLVEAFRGRVVDIQHDNLMMEVSGTEGKVESFIDLMRPYGIIELARTGRIALVRGTPAKTEE